MTPEFPDRQLLKHFLACDTFDVIDFLSPVRLVTLMQSIGVFCWLSDKELPSTDEMALAELVSVYAMLAVRHSEEMHAIHPGEMIGYLSTNVQDRLATVACDMQNMVNKAKGRPKEGVVIPNSNTRKALLKALGATPLTDPNTLCGALIDIEKTSRSTID